MQVLINPLCLPKEMRKRSASLIWLCLCRNVQDRSQAYCSIAWIYSKQRQLPLWWSDFSPCCNIVLNSQIYPSTSSRLPRMESLYNKSDGRSNRSCTLLMMAGLIFPLNQVVVHQNRSIVEILEQCRTPRAQAGESSCGYTCASFFVGLPRVHAKCLSSGFLIDFSHAHE